MLIPKIIHQIWIQGFDELPEDLKSKHLLLKEYNPDYKIILWDDKKIQKLLEKYEAIKFLYNNTEILHGFIKKYQSQSDIARLVILREYGGFYIDIDYYCPLSLNKIYNDDDDVVVVGSEYKLLKYIPFIYCPKYGASFIGISKKHKLFDALLVKLGKQTDKNRIGVLFDRYLQQYHYKVKIIDTEYVSSHTSCCSGICTTPKESTNIMGREILIYIGCHIYLIFIIVIIIFIIIMVIKK